MDYIIITLTLLIGLLFHTWLFVRFKRWMDRDQALILANGDPKKRAWVLKQLQEAKRQKIQYRDIPRWLEERKKQPSLGSAETKLS
ncbi:hypothetical protein LX59_02082 [Azomonas agilis]|uniref:30S ribosomal protein S3 n=1 Tax=Azomonas agilis TaxID=116849 RepID=A0A562I230_9GAMM|nr:hypothetical protein [Azomonas agilis]TWH64735.1 hypothetical protein LX59_02082 [Azomonas agilis]